MAIPNDVFAAALAHNLSPAAITTWNPDIARSPRVLVPIELTVLAVRTETSTWADCKMAAPPTDAPGDITPAVDLLPEPFKNLDAPRPTGVYLHWALPDALTQGRVSATDPDVAFPAIPDRWLILRLSAGRTTSRRAVAGWVLVAGGETPVVIDIATWKDPVNPDDPPPSDVRKPLTALGRGDPSGPPIRRVENRLAHDPLADVAGPLACTGVRMAQLSTDDPSAKASAPIRSSSSACRNSAGGPVGRPQRFVRRTRFAAALSGVATREARLRLPRSRGAGANLVLQRARDVRASSAQAASVDKFGAAEGVAFSSPGRLARLHALPWRRRLIGWPGSASASRRTGLLGGRSDPPRRRA